PIVRLVGLLLLLLLAQVLPLRRRTAAMLALNGLDREKANASTSRRSSDGRDLHRETRSSERGGCHTGRGPHIVRVSTAQLVVLRDLRPRGRVLGLQCCGSGSGFWVEDALKPGLPHLVIDGSSGRAGRTMDI